MSADEVTTPSKAAAATVSTATDNNVIDAVETTTPPPPKGIIATLTAVATSMIRATTAEDGVTAMDESKDDAMDIDKMDDESVGKNDVVIDAEPGAVKATEDYTAMATKDDDVDGAAASPMKGKTEDVVEQVASKTIAPTAKKEDKDRSMDEGAVAVQSMPSKEPKKSNGGSTNDTESEKEEDDSVVNQQVKNVKDTVKALTEKRLGEELDGALDSLHEAISKAILAQGKEKDNVSNLNMNDKDKKKSNAAYANLRDAAAKAYHALVIYGSSNDLSCHGEGSEAKDKSTDSVSTMSEARRSRLHDVGRNLWMAIRNNSELFNDMVGNTSSEAVGEDFALFEGQKCKAVAGGYARVIAARLVFLDYIDTRCSIGRPPVLHDASLSDGRKSPSLQELVFGLKLFSRAGRIILDNNRKDARASFDSLSLALACFDAISMMAAGGNGEAGDQLKGLYDESFEAFTMLPDSASLFGAECDKDDGDTQVVRRNDVPWQKLVIKSLERAESFIDNHCNVFKTKSSTAGDLSASKLATLQRYLPSLARLCYKHGGHFVKLHDHDNAGKVLQIALKSTNSCLAEISEEIADGKSGRKKQMLHNLEAELVVVSIEALYLLSVSFQASGDKEKALLCLDRVEAYMTEQHNRDNELYLDATNRLGSGDGFVFSEGSTASSALEGDKADIKNRARNAQENARSRHDTELATLAFSRIMIFHRTLPSPSSEEESLIDNKMKELIDLAIKVTSVTTADFGSAQHALISSTGGKPNGSDNMLHLTLEAIRLVHVRRTTKYTGSTIAGDTNAQSCADNYRLLLEKLGKNHFRKPFVMLDRLRAMLAADYQLRERKLDSQSIRHLDNETLKMAKEYVDTIKTFMDSGREERGSTLFAASSHILSKDVYEESQAHFARAVSLYHSLDNHELCSQWADLLQTILQVRHPNSARTLEELDALLGNVMTVKAVSLSKSGNHASGLKTAREAWTKVKTVDSLVNLFHCSLRQELKHHSCDTMLEFDNALSELLNLSSHNVDEVLDSFPRLSNCCVENEANGGELILLGVQERWIDHLLQSQTFRQYLKERDASIVPELSLFDILRAYLNNIEGIITLDKEGNSITRNLESLGRIVDGVMKLMVEVRETKKLRTKARRKKLKTASKTKKEKNDFVLIWDDPSIKALIGDRGDCVFTAEQLWNIGNQLMAIDSSRKGGLSGIVAADVFAASHDFCLLSEEEEGECLSKGYLDFDVKFDPTKTLLPKFGSNGGGSDDERQPCDISSEFSGQCLLISVAVAVDHASSCMNGKGKGVDAVDNEVQILLSRSLHRLAQAQEELQLNATDKQQCQQSRKMIVLLTLRCLLGVADDPLAIDSLTSNGLYDALLSLDDTTKKEDGEGVEFLALRNVKLMADLADERSMREASRMLHRLCAEQMSKAGKFLLDIGDDFVLSLGSIQIGLIQSASSSKEVLDVYDEIGSLLKNRSEDENNSSFYSMSDLTWFAKDANNRAVEHEMLGDDVNAERLFAVALSLLPLCHQEMQFHAKQMNAAYQSVLSKKHNEWGSLFDLEPNQGVRN